MEMFVITVMKEIKTYTEHYFLDDQNQIHGEYKRWYENGQLLRHCFYDHGLYHGEYRSWYENGQTWEHCFYDHGLRHGEYKRWYENGQLLRHCFYDQGKIIVDFTKNPELYPETEEDKLIFALKYGSGPFLSITI